MDRAPGQHPTGRRCSSLAFYSDKTLINDKGAAAHPVRLSLLNVGYPARMQLRNLATLGYMPIIARPAGMKTSDFRRLNHFARHCCLKILLEPLKQLSHEGTFINDPVGKSQLVFPRLLSVVGDHPEILTLACHFHLRHATETMLQVPSITRQHG